MQAVDVTGQDTEVKPVHPSVLSQDHCFHVATSHGSKYISCRTAEERDKWLSSLRRTIKPNQEHVRRSDSSLKLWIVEAKNVQPKKRYFCEILLDRKLYARTSSKLMGEMLFWGEHFEFKDLPAVETITVNMYREADKKKKKDRNTLVCYVKLAVTDMSNKQFVEKWFSSSWGTVGKAGKETKGEQPLIRMKVRHQTVDILPMDLYHDFSKYLTTDYYQLCELLEPAMSVREKEEFATTLVHAMHKLGKARSFLCDVVMCEIGRLDNEHLTFRGNSIATKAMEAYMKLVGERYLHDTLGDFVRQLVESEEDCEVDPTKVANNATLQCHQSNLEMFATMAWVKIINSYCYFPTELREVFTNFRQHCRDHGKEDFSDNLISGSIFLRFLCPAILSPSLFNLTQEYPQERAARNLTLIAKTIQTLANFTQFGGKEEFMTFMNRFIEKEAVNMKDFLRKISSEETDNQFLQFDGYIDLGRELSLLHSVLHDFLNRSSEATQKKFSRLLSILTALSQAQDDPSVGQTAASRKSQIFYDNMHTSPASSSSNSSSSHSSSSHSASHHPHHRPHNYPSSLPPPPGGMHAVHSAPYLDTSPTEALRDMLRQCGESEEDLHAFAARAAPGARDTARETESAPPTLLLTPHKGQQEEELDLEFSALYSSTSVTSSSISSSGGGGGGGERGKGGGGSRGEVGDVSVSAQRLNDASVKQTWSQMVSAADNNNHNVSGSSNSNINGDYIDLIPFMDEESGGVNSSLELDGPPTASTGSQMSISQLSTVASSGYQSLGYSQSSSPVEGGGGGGGALPGAGQASESSREVTRSPIIHYPMQPLSFNNPMYRHHQLSSRPHHHNHNPHPHHHQQQQQQPHHHHHHQRGPGQQPGGYPSPQHQTLEATRVTKEDSCSSLSSGDEGAGGEQRSLRGGKQQPQSSPLRTGRAQASSCMDPLRKLSQLSSSSGSNESLNDPRAYPPAAPQPPLQGGAGVRLPLGGGGGRGASPPPATAGQSSSSSSSSSPPSAPSHWHGPPPEVPPRPDRLLSKWATTVPPSLSSSSSSGGGGGGDPDSQTPPVVPPRPQRTTSYCDASSSSSAGSGSGGGGGGGGEPRQLGLRPYHLSHSMDFGCLQRQPSDQLRRAATDSVIARPPSSTATSTPTHTKAASNGGGGGVEAGGALWREDSLSSVHSSQSQGSLNRRLSPQSTVHMGISSVQRKLQEQERTKQEYENEVHVLRQQLVEAQVRLQSAEMRLMDHEVDTHHLMEEWQSRLAESEQRIRQQQAEKDGQMKSIIERLVTIEDELRKEQRDMQQVVQEKQAVIEVQEQRLRTLDSANLKLLQALHDLKEHDASPTDNTNNNSSSSSSSTTNIGTARNGITTGSLRPKLTAADFTGFKSSTC